MFRIDELFIIRRYFTVYAAYGIFLADNILKLCKYTYIFTKSLKNFIELKFQIILKDFLGVIISTSENSIVSYAIVKFLYIPSTLASNQHDQSGTGFRWWWCWSIDQLVWWEVAFCRSWITWYVGLCSPMYGSGMSFLWWWYDRMFKLY